MYFVKKTAKISLFLSIVLYLNSCGIYKPTDARKFPPEPKKRVQKNLEEGRGIKLFDTKNKGNGTFDFATSNELWRASLDTLDFIPLISADYGGGIIITDWYNENNSYEDSIKISVRFLTNEIRSDAIKIIIHKKKCETFNNCKITNIESETNSQIKFAILKKAAELEKKDLEKTKEKNSDVRLPKNF